MTSRILRDRNNIKKPILYSPDIKYNELDGNESVDTDWENDSKFSDNESTDENEYVYDDFLVPDESIEYESGDSSEESEYTDDTDTDTDTETEDETPQIT